MTIRSILANILDRIVIIHRKNRVIRKYMNKKLRSIDKSFRLTSQQKKEIKSFYKQHYGKNVSCYWHRHYSAYTMQYDLYYLPETLCIPEFEHYMNLFDEYVKVFSDKNVLPILSGCFGVKMPRTIFSCSNSIFANSRYQEIDKNEAFSLLEYEVGGGIHKTKHRVKFGERV